MFSRRYPGLLEEITQHIKESPGLAWGYIVSPCRHVVFSDFSTSLSIFQKQIAKFRSTFKYWPFLAVNWVKKLSWWGLTVLQRLEWITLICDAWPENELHWWSKTVEVSGRKLHSVTGAGRYDQHLWSFCWRIPASSAYNPQHLNTGNISYSSACYGDINIITHRGGNCLRYAILSIPLHKWIHE